MPPMPAGVQQHRGPAWYDKVKMGALMGGTVGSIMGFIYGTITIFQHGAGTLGPMRMLGRYMAGSGGMFAVFMGVGSLIRTDADARSAAIWQAHRNRVYVYPRTDLKGEQR